MYQPIPTVQIGFYLLVAFILEGLAIYTWQYRKLPGALSQTITQMGRVLWLTSIVLRSISIDLPYKMFWISIEEATSITVLYFWGKMILEISRQDKQVSVVLQRCILGFVVLAWVIIFSNGWHGWYWGPVSLDGNDIELSYGPFCVLTWWFSRLMMLLNITLCVRWVLKDAGLRRWQAIGMSVTPLASLSGFLLYDELNFTLIPSLPLGFLVEGVFVTWVYYRWRVYSIMPFAQQAVIRNMIDGLLVIDEEEYIVEANPAAQKIFTDLLPTLNGRKFSDVTKAWPNLAAQNIKNTRDGVEVFLEQAGQVRYYYVQVFSLTNQGNYYLGKVLLLKDITKHKLDQAQLLEKEKALSILAERNRLGRELHDGDAQMWSYLQMELQMVQRLLKEGQWKQAQEQLERIKQLTVEVTTDVRASIASLKSSASERHDFIVMLQEYLEWYEKNYGIAISLELVEKLSMTMLNPTREVQLLRIIQEALNNIRKHAQAKQVMVRLAATEEKMVAEIIDDGRGLDMARSSLSKKSYGIQIMRERAEEAGGCLEIQSKPGKGTIIRVIFKKDERTQELSRLIKASGMMVVS